MDASIFQLLLDIFINVFSQLSLNSWGFLISFLIMVFLSGAEYFYKKKRVISLIRKNSYINNFLILFFNNFFLFLISGSFLYLIAQSNSLGLLNFIPNPLFKFILSLLIFDLLIYFWHQLNHKIPFLWNFHRCHHSDKDLNTSTSFRFHIGELILSLFYKSFFIFLLGFQATFIIFYEWSIFCFAAFHHSNIKIPLEKQLNYLLVMPSHHSTHHSPLIENHNSNYGVIFSFWDRIFKSYNSHQPQTFGLAGVKEKKILSFLNFGLPKKNNRFWIFIIFIILISILFYLKTTKINL